MTSGSRGTTRDHGEGGAAHKNSTVILEDKTDDYQRLGAKTHKSMSSVAS